MFKDVEIVEVASVRDQVADIIRRMILSNELEPGKQLVERAMSEKLNISTTPVKEAFRILQTEGLIYTIPRRGSFVSEFAKSNLEQMVFVRSALDGVATFLATINISQSGIDKLQQVLKYSEENIAEGDVTSLAQNNKEFHSIIRNSSNNQYLIHLIENMNTMDRTVRELALSRDLAEKVRAHQEHICILKAIESRDAARAETLSVNHVRRVVQYVMEE